MSGRPATPHRPARPRPGRPVRGAWLWILPLLLAVSWGCSREERVSAAPRGQAGPPPVRITAVPVETRDVQRTVDLVGTLMPEEEITVSNENPGTIQRILVDLGDRVKAGQLLAQLDTREPQFAVEQARATLALAKKNVDRAKAALTAGQSNVVRLQAVLRNAQVNRRRFEELFTDGAVSASQRDSAVTEADVAQASLRSAEAQRESDREAVAVAISAVAQAEPALAIAEKRHQDTEVRAPLAGEVQKRLVSSGEAVKEKTPLLVLVRTETLKLSGEIPERFAAEVRTGQPVRVGTDAIPSRQFAGRLVRIAPAVNPATRSFAIEAAIPNPDGALKAGAFAKAAVLIRKDSGVPFLPEEAVVSFAGITKVFVVANGTVAEREVRLGERQDGMVEVLAGVKPGELVANSNLGQLVQGRAVTVEAATK